MGWEYCYIVLLGIRMQLEIQALGIESSWKELDIIGLYYLTDIIYMLLSYIGLFFYELELKYHRWVSLRIIT